MEARNRCKSKPKVSVIMPAYNAQKYIMEAIDSILTQTLSDFELIVVDDCSTDNTFSILQSLKDKRLRIFRNEANIGIADTLNRGIALSNSEYIARMDADDISMPTRLETQVDFMENNPDIGICGTWAITFGGSEIKIMPEYEHASIMFCMMLDCCFVHPSVVLRKEVLSRFNLKYENVPAEDYDLFSKIVALTKSANIAEFLLKYRVHDRQLTSQKEKIIAKHAQEIRIAQLNRLIGKTEDIEGFDALREDNFSIDKIPKILITSVAIIEFNKNKMLYDQMTLNTFFERKFGRIYKVLRDNKNKQTKRYIFSNKAIIYKVYGVRRFLSILLRNYFLAKK